MTAALGRAEAKRGHLHDMGLPILFGAVVLLVSAAMLLGANISALRGNLAWIERSQQVLNQIGILEAAVLSEEMTVRGYALTGDQRFIVYRKNERLRCRNSLAELRRLSAGSHRVAQFAALDRAVQRHLDLFGSLAINGPDRTQVVARAIVDPVVRENMTRTRDGLERLRAAELKDLGARERDVTNQLAHAFFLAVGIILAAFLLGGIGVWAVQIKAPKL